MASVLLSVVSMGLAVALVQVVAVGLELAAVGLRRVQRARNRWLAVALRGVAVGLRRAAVAVDGLSDWLDGLGGDVLGELRLARYVRVPARVDFVPAVEWSPREQQQEIEYALVEEPEPVWQTPGVEDEASVDTVLDVPAPVAQKPKRVVRKCEQCGKRRKPAFVGAGCCKQCNDAGVLELANQVA